MVMGFNKNRVRRGVVGLLLGTALGLAVAGCTNDSPNRYLLMERSMSAGPQRPETTGRQADSPTGGATLDPNKATPNMVR